MSGRFAKDDASATRVLTFCKILNDLEKDVIVISLDEIKPYELNLHNKVKFFSLRSISNSFLNKILNFLFFKKRLKKAINILGENYKIEGLFFYDIPANAILFLKKYARKNKIKIFHDSVEWYSPQQFKWGKLALPYISKNLLNKYFIDKQISVFAISKYLKNYFQSKGIHVTRIPIMLDMNRINHEKHIAPDKLTLMYAGSPGKKDYLKEIIEGLSKLSEENLKKVELHIFGVTKTQLIEDCMVSPKTIEICKNSLIAHGRVSRDSVLLHLQNTDFTVLLRASELRYAKAGFPTKVVESLATATPVICNITSDLGDYLIDGNNCLVVDDCSSASFETTLLKALTLSIEEKHLLCNNARATAEKDFDYKKYLEQFKTFLYQ
jgi:glycosyltransferase involved in cell wall biosynthesis